MNFVCELISSQTFWGAVEAIGVLIGVLISVHIYRKTVNQQTESQLRQEEFAKSSQLREEAFVIKSWFYDKYIEKGIEPIIAWFIDLSARGFTDEDYQDSLNAELCHSISRIEMLLDTNIIFAHLNLIRDYSIAHKKKYPPSDTELNTPDTLDVLLNDTREWLCELQMLLIEIDFAGESRNAILKVEDNPNVITHLEKLEAIDEIWKKYLLIEGFNVVRRAE